MENVFITFGPGLSLHSLPYFVYASSEGSSETGQICSNCRASAAPRCNKYLNHICWLSLFLPV